MHQVTEFLASEGIVAEVLDDRPAVGVGVRFLDLVIGQAREALLNQWTDVRRPQQVNDFLVREDGVGEAGPGRECEENEQRERASWVQNSGLRQARRVVPR